jgi:hypothetical protein
MRWTRFTMAVMVGFTMAVTAVADDHPAAPANVAVPAGVMTLDGSTAASLRDACRDDTDCGNPTKPHCCCGLTASGAIACSCREACS